MQSCGTKRANHATRTSSSITDYHFMMRRATRIMIYIELTVLLSSSLDLFSQLLPPLPLLLLAPLPLTLN